ncbi:unnamed protein product [Discula destructiva]
MKYIFSTLAAASLAAAHGYVSSADIGGKTYDFYNPNADPYTSPAPERISRAIPGNGPVMDVMSADVQCGGYTEGGVPGSSPAALHAPVTAGSDVTLHWTLWPSTHWGALITYMARCPDTGCDAWMPESSAVWFKIAESGMTKYVSGGDTNEWAVDSLTVDGNAGYTYTVPSCLADGYYLVRHEILAVFVANTYPGAQVYPGCHQLQVTGGGSTTPTDLVAFPGAYTPEDAGITWDSSSSTTYPIPGPAVMSCDGSAGSGSGTPPSTAANSAAAAAEEEEPAVESSAPVTSSMAAASSAAAMPTGGSYPTTLATHVVSAAPEPTDDAEDEGCTRKRGLRRGRRHGSMA